MDAVPHAAPQLLTPRMKHLTSQLACTSSSTTCSSLHQCDTLSSRASGSSLSDIGSLRRLSDDCRETQSVASSCHHSSDHASNYGESRALKPSLADSITEMQARGQQPWAEERHQLRERILELEATVRSKEETISLYRDKVGMLMTQLRQRHDAEAELRELQKAIMERDEAYRLLERRARSAEEAKTEQQQRFATAHEDIAQQMETLQDHHIRAVENLEAQLKAMTQERDRVSEQLFGAKEHQKIMGAELGFVHRIQEGNAQHHHSRDCERGNAQHHHSRDCERGVAPSTVGHGAILAVTCTESMRAMHASQQLTPQRRMPAVCPTLLAGSTRIASCGGVCEPHPYTQCI